MPLHTHPFACFVSFPIRDSLMGWGSNPTSTPKFWHTRCLCPPCFSPPGGPRRDSNTHPPSSRAGLCNWNWAWSPGCPVFSGCPVCVAAQRSVCGGSTTDLCVAARPELCMADARCDRAAVEASELVDHMQRRRQVSGCVFLRRVRSRLNPLGRVLLARANKWGGAARHRCFHRGRLLKRANS